MFGNKKSKAERHAKIIELVRKAHPHGVTPAELAKILNVPNSTILRDLPEIDKKVMLDEFNNRLRIASFDYGD